MMSKMSKISIKMECPFTWGIDDQLSKNFDEKEEPSIGADEEPLFALINSIMITYFRAVQGNYQGALENLEVTDAIWKVFDEKVQRAETGKLVLQHVIQATEYQVLRMSARLSEANNVLKNLRDPQFFQQPIQQATFDGCKAVAWTCFHEKGHVKASALAKLAVSNDPKCPLWYYILSKNLRYARRYEKGSFNPSTAERDTIIKCCQLSNLPFYKIHLAQMYRESKMNQKSKEIYMEIYVTNPKSYGILLRLARAFTAFKDFDKAKKCFDDLEKQPKTSMFWHFKGIFYEKQKDLRKAAECYKKAAENGNYRADLQYSITMNKMLKNKFDVIGHLSKMLDKYVGYPAYNQQIFLHIGMQYASKQSNLEQALGYFLKAIEMNPQSDVLKTFTSSTTDWKEYDIYDLVSKKIKEIGSTHVESPDSVHAVVGKLKDLCEQHKKVQILESLGKMKI